MSEDVHIHGGAVEIVNCQGDVIMHGGVVERMNVQGDCKQYGGIVEHVKMANINGSHLTEFINETVDRHAKPLIELTERLKRENNELRKRLNGIGTLESLKAYNKRLSLENEELKNKCSKLKIELIKRKEAEEKTDNIQDDVLVMRIETLEAQIERERKSHINEVEELQERIDVALEINARLRHHNEESDNRSQEIAYKHIDILATILSLYPFTPDKDIAFEFGIPADKISMVAKILGVVKSPEARREAVDYLQRQHRDFIQRRGGAQKKHFTKPVEKVSKKGNIRNNENQNSQQHGRHLRRDVDQS